MPYRFLSDKWFDAVEALRDGAPEPPEAVRDITLNVVVTGGPEGDVKGHVTAGRVERDLADGAPTTITIPFEVAKRLFIDGDPAAAIQSLLTGEITIEGDPTPLVPLQFAFASPTLEQLAFQRKVQALTI